LSEEGIGSVKNSPKAQGVARTWYAAKVMVWLPITAAFVAMWIGLGVFLFQVLRYTRARREAEGRGEGWDEGL
jgi:hypothetical protein